MNFFKSILITQKLNYITIHQQCKKCKIKNICQNKINYIENQEIKTIFKIPIINIIINNRNKEVEIKNRKRAVNNQNIK